MSGGTQETYVPVLLSLSENVLTCSVTALTINAFRAPTATPFLEGGAFRLRAWTLSSPLG